MAKIRSFQINTKELGADPDLQSGILHDNLNGVLGTTNTHADIDAHIGSPPGRQHTAVEILHVATGSPPSGPMNVQTALESKMVWLNGWVDGPTYYKNDVVRDGDWTMVANKQTTDAAAPQDQGQPHTSPPSGTAWTTASYTGVVKMITHFTTNQSGWFKQLRVRTASWDADTVTRITVWNVTDDTLTIYDNPILKNDDWTVLALSSAIAPAGTEYEVWYEYYNSAVASEIIGDWGSNAGTGAPASQEFNIDDLTNPTILEIHHTDLDNGNRQVELDGVIADSIIDITEVGDNTRNITVKVTAIDTTDASSTKYTVSTVGNGAKDIRNGRDCEININAPIGIPSVYNVNADYWAINPPVYATVETHLEYDGVIQSGSPALGSPPASSTDAYGVELTFQHAAVSPDWDILSVVGTGGSGGGGTPTTIRDTLDGNGAITEALSANQGYVLDQNASTHLANAGNPHTTSVANLFDTIITLPANTEVLTFNGTDWVNLPATGGGTGSPPGSAIWGNITGTLSDQTDLQNVLTSHTHTELYLSAAVKADTATTGLNIRGNATALPDTTDPANTVLNLYNDTGTGLLSAYGFLNDSSLRLDNYMRGWIEFRSTNNSSVLTSLIQADPNSSVNLLYAGNIKVQTATTGLNVRGSVDTGSPPSASLFDTAIGLYDSSGTNLLSSFGHISSKNLRIDNWEAGGLLQIRSIKILGGSELLFSGDPDGGTAAYFKGDLKTSTLTAGLQIRGSITAATIPPTSSDPLNTQIFLTDFNGITSARLGYLGSASLTFRNEVEGANILLQPTNAAGTLVNGITIDPGLATSLYHSGVIRAGTTGAGWRVFGDIPTADPPVAELISTNISFTDDDASAAVGTVGFTGNNTLRIQNFMKGGLIVLQGADSGTGNSNIIIGDPDASTDLYYAGVAVARTKTTATGGFEVNNTDTAAGWERVLTISDSISTGGPLIINTVTGTTYTPVVGDARNMVETTNSAAVTITLPDNIFVAGDEILFEQNGTGQIAFAPGTGVTINSPGGLTSTTQQYSTVAVIYKSASTCLLAGDLA